MAGFRLPNVLKNVLPNAASAGYLENVSRGEYRLNPVGYNLVDLSLNDLSDFSTTKTNFFPRDAGVFCTTGTAWRIGS